MAFKFFVSISLSHSRHKYCEFLSLCSQTVSHNLALFDDTLPHVTQPFVHYFHVVSFCHIGGLNDK